MSKHNLDSRVDISGYISTPYICPEDGYIFLYNDDTTADGYVQFGIYGEMSIGGNKGRFCCYVRKGFAVKVVKAGTLTCFVPLV